MAAKKILLVDDDEYFVESTKAILESKGYEVEVAGDGEEGLSKVEQCPPDLVILDVMMTTLSEGFEVSRRLRSDEKTREIPILMLTSVSKRFNMPFAPDEDWLPVDTFLEKPVEPEVLLQEVQRILGD